MMAHEIYKFERHIGADFLVKNNKCHCNYCGYVSDGEAFTGDSVGPGYTLMMSHIREKHDDVLTALGLQQQDISDKICGFKDGYDEIIAFDKPKEVPEQPPEVKTELVRYVTNIGEDKIIDTIQRMYRDKKIPLEDIVVGRNKRGNYTLHYHIEC